VHDSATSQIPAETRQTVPAATDPSAGQLGEVPVQASATSQTPAEGRHTVPAEADPSAGQTGEVPVHASATSQTSAAARHTVPAGALASAGQLVPAPSQTSVASQTDVAARHTVPAARGVTIVQINEPDAHAAMPTPHAPDEHATGAMSSTVPLQSLSTPSQTSVVGVPAVALHVGPLEPQPAVPMRAQAPTPDTQVLPTVTHVETHAT
jgi:hypothetical protein